jgi:hypothetical protein
LGTHSERKGAMSYVSSGSTCSPSSETIHLRSGHSLGNVDDKYYSLQKAGDQYCGRVVAGLPISQAEFAILPPHFPQQANRNVIVDAINACFPGFPSSMALVLEHCLACLVWHSDFLKKEMPQAAPLFQTGQLEKLKTLVVCKLAEP